jgi:uncharacterized protein
MPQTRSETTRMRTKHLLLSMPRSPTWVLVVVLLWTTAGSLWLFSPWFPMQLLRDLQHASGGWASITLMASASLGAVVLALVFGPGRQRLADVGWRWNKLGLGLAITLALWAAMQLASLFGQLATGDPAVLAPAWNQGLGIALGPLLAQLLGTALVEETVMRAWLWPQLRIRWQGRMGAGRALWSALFASQLLFALLHLPMLLSRGAAPAELAGSLMMLFLVGIVFAAVYAATGNIFIAVGAHALGNAPTMLIAPGSVQPTLALLVSLLLMIGGCALHRRYGSAAKPGESSEDPARTAA